MPSAGASGWSRRTTPASATATPRRSTPSTPSPTRSRASAARSGSTASCPTCSTGARRSASGSPRANPDWIAGLVVQNGNAYEAGLSPAAREYVAARPEHEGGEPKMRGLLTLKAIRDQYLHGVRDPEAVSPDGWTLDHHFLQLPGRQQIQVDLSFNYHSNVELYPHWQVWLREHRPPTLVVSGRNDPFFTEAGALSFREDVPDAEVELFDTGHFALEERVDEIAPLVASFVERTWSPAGPART